MTYTSSGLNYTLPLQVAMLTWSGTPSLNAFMNFSIDDELPSTFITSITSNTTINLPAGNYFAQAFIDYTRTLTTQNCVFYFYVDDVQKEHEGQTDFYNNYSADNAETTFTLTQAGTLKLKITAVNGSAVTLTNHCKILLWRSA